MKILKRLFYIIILIIVLLMVAAFLASRFINPNNYKDKIAAVVHEKTGRNLVIQGQIELAFFPWIGVRVHDAQLSNAPGFQPAQFATVGEVDVSVKVLPLLSRQVEVGKVTLRDVTLNLAKNQQGVTNWQDLTAQQTSGTMQSSAKKPTTAGLVLSVAAVNIENANVSWVDAQKGQTVRLKNVQVTSDNPGFGHAFPFSMTFDINSVKPDLAGHFALKSEILADKNSGTYQLKNPRIDFAPTKGAQALSLQADQVSADLHAQTLMVTNGVVSSGDLKAKFNIQGQQIVDKPVFTGQLVTAPFNLKNLLKMSGKTIATTDPNALQKVVITTQFTGTTASLSLKPLTLNIDSSTIKGDFAITDFATQALAFNLNVDQLNVDNYLPPDTAPRSAPGGTPAVGAAASAGSQPAAMRQGNIRGSLRIGRLVAAKTALQQVVAQMVLSGGVLNIDPFSANVYGGSMHGKVAIDFRGAVPKYAIDENLTNVDLTQLVKSGRVVGRANVTTHLTLQGQGKPAMMRSLNGNMQFNVQNGALVGADIPYLVNRAIALIKRQLPPPAPTQNQTNFDVLKGSGTFNNGVFSNNDLLVQSAQFRATGQGTVNLVTEALDYHLLLAGLHTVTGPQGNAVLEQGRTTIPVMITGTFDKPVITPDLKAFLQSEVGQRVIERVQQKLGPNGGMLLRQLLSH